MRRSLVYAALIGWAGCRAAPTLDARLAQTLTEVRAQARAYLSEQSERDWQSWLHGSAPPPTVAADTLVSPRTIDTVRRALRATPPGDERRALRYLHALLIREHLRQALLGLDERIAAIGTSTLAVDDRPVAYRDLPRLIAADPDPAHRRQLADMALPAVAQLLPLIDARQVEIEKVARKLDYHDSVQLYSEINQLDMRRAHELAQRVLRDSDPLYLTTLAEAAPKGLGVPLSSLRATDLPRLIYATTQDAQPLVPRVEAAFLELGIALSALPIRIDTRALATKNPRSACFPVQVPSDIRISLKPTDGGADLTALLHELGHALHFAHTRTDVFEFATLGDHSVSEAFAFLIEGLADEPTWLAGTFGLDQGAAHSQVRAGVLRRLVMIRRYAARLSMTLDPPRGRDLRKAAREELHKTYGFTFENSDVERTLAEYDPFLAAADYVRGWVLAAQMRDVLRHRFGEQWWRDTRAGELLKELWASGQHDTAEELAARLGLVGLDARALLAWAAGVMVERQP